MVSTLGVLGTFSGITLGLLFFDTSNLERSIPLLLSGLKTAFLTSLAGMTGSIILNRKVSHLFDEQDKGIKEEDVRVDKIVKAISNLMNLVAAVRDDLANLRNEVKKQSEYTKQYNSVAQEDFKQMLSEMRDDVEEINGHGDAFESLCTTATGLSRKLDELSTVGGDLGELRKELSTLRALVLTQTESAAQLEDHARQIADAEQRLLGLSEEVNKTLESLGSRISERKRA